MITTVAVDQELGQFERACRGFDSDRPGADEELGRRWRHGVALFDALRTAEAHCDELTRLQAAVTALASHWLQPRSTTETRDRVVGRIAALKVPELNDRLIELLPKNTRGTLTAEERVEFERLHERLDFFQDALSAAIHALPPGS